MNPYFLYLTGGAFAVIAVVAIYLGLKDGISERKTVWSMLKRRFGVPSRNFDRSNDPSSVLGEMRLLEQVFVGHISVVGRGVVFRRDYLKRHELLLFPWDVVEDFQPESDSESFARFSFARSAGLPVNVRISWSPLLSRSAPSTQ